MKPKGMHRSCALAPVMQATSKRRADLAKRMCCRNPAVLGDRAEHLSLSAVNNQQKTSTKVVQRLTRIVTRFGSKSELDSPASETVKVEVNASDSEVSDALLEHSDGPSISLPHSRQGLSLFFVKHLCIFLASPTSHDTELTMCLTQLPCLAGERVLSAASEISQQEGTQGKVVAHTVIHLEDLSAYVMQTSAFMSHAAPSPPTMCQP